MCYILTDGSNYVSQVKTGFTVVGNISKAQKFSTLEKANNTLKSLPKLLRKFDFKLEEYIESEDQEKISRDKIFKKMQEDDASYDNLMTNVFQRMYEF
jgi:hypothetical protein